MYVRWVVRKHKNAATANVTFYDAYLVESFRDEQNEPRQRTICYLGNIRQIDGTFPPIERELFFIRAEQVMTSDPDVPPHEREQVRHLLRQKIPELTPVEVMTAFRANVRWFYQRWRADGNAPTRTELLNLIDTAADDIDAI